MLNGFSGYSWMYTGENVSKTGPVTVLYQFFWKAGHIL